jgi:hypothetical protein
MSEKTYQQIKDEYFGAYNASKDKSNEECTLKLEGCENDNSYFYQKQIRIFRSEYVTDSMVQTADNLIFCCENCYHWVMYNQAEATALGHLNW